MQEGTVGWDPMGEYRLPWQGKLLVLYQLVVTAVLVARSIMLVGDIRALRTENDKFTYLWEMSMARVVSLKKLALLTLLVSGLTAVALIVRFFARMQVLHAGWSGAVAGGIAEILLFLELGLFVCTALYAVSSFYAGMLTRRRIAWNHSRPGASTGLQARE